MHTLPRHQCIIYKGSPERHLQSLALTIAGKLKSNKRCMYLHNPEMVAQMQAVLATAGLNPQAEMEKGSLILTSDQSHLVNGQFDVDRMLDMLNAGVEKALADGYAGLWATGDMTWELGEDKNFDKLFEYEHKLEEYMQKTPALSGICQYHQDTIPLHAIETGLHTHPAVYINETLSRINPKYAPNAA